MRWPFDALEVSVDVQGGQSQSIEAMEFIGDDLVRLEPDSLVPHDSGVQVRFSLAKEWPKSPTLASGTLHLKGKSLQSEVRLKFFLNAATVAAN